MLINHIIIILNHIKGNLEFLEQCRTALPFFSDITVLDVYITSRGARFARLLLLSIHRYFHHIATYLHTCML